MVLTIGPRSLLFLKILVHLGSLLPLCWAVWAYFNGALGADPVREITHFLGKGAIHLLFLTLLVSPLAKGLQAGSLLRLRRPLGLWCFTWASCHFGVWIALDLQFFWSLIGEEIVKRTYILVGFTAWLILTALAITSIPALLRKMGRTWKKLHNWIYLVALLAPLHYLWSVKSGIIEPGIYFVIALILLWFRRKTLMRPIQAWRQHE